MDWNPDIEIIDDNPPPADNWVFLVGMPRTGSSAASEVLNMHPEAGITNEWYPWGFVETLTTKFFDLPSGRRMCHYHLVKHATGDGELSWKATKLRKILEGIWDVLFPGSTVRGDKQPAQYIQVLPQLLTVFPECKFVVPVRNIWDVAGSLFVRLQRFKDDPPDSQKNKDYSWVGRMSRMDLAKYLMDKLTEGPWAERKKILLEHTNSDQREYIRFSWMAEDLESELIRVLEFLGLEPGEMPFERAISETHYPDAIGRCEDVPELVELEQSGAYKNQEITEDEQVE